MTTTMRAVLPRHMLRKISKLVLALGIIQLYIILKKRTYLGLIGSSKLDEMAYSVLTLERISNNTLAAISHCRHDKNRSLYDSFDALFAPPVYYLLDDKEMYFMKSGQKTCFTEGTDPLSFAKGTGRCMCKELWHGEDCSFPEAFVSSDMPNSYNITRRTKPRRIIYAFPFNIEFEMAEAAFSELGDIVDVFIVSESNYSAHGDPKPLRMLERLKSGFCSNLQHKIVYMYVGYFPQAAYKNGWVADDLPRDELGSRGIREQIRGVRHDDIFILTDADEMPTRDPLLFLKLHDGFPEPFGFHLHRTTFGFFWLSGNGDWPILSGVTVRMLNHVFEGKASKIRNTAGHLEELSNNLNTYISSGGLVHMWKFGNSNFKTGWHCSWCFGIPEMQIKLQSAMNGDFPRWGDYPEKRNPDNLNGMIVNGKWFSGDNLAMNSENARVRYDYRLYAPRYIIRNINRFRYLLKHPNS